MGFTSVLLYGMNICHVSTFLSTFNREATAVSFKNLSGYKVTTHVCWHAHTHAHRANPCCYTSEEWFPLESRGRDEGSSRMLGYVLVLDLGGGLHERIHFVLIHCFFNKEFLEIS